MTTMTTAAPPLQRAAGWAAVLGTIPYLTLKATWLGGGTAGITDPALLAGPGIVAANAVTFVLDLCVIGLALALTQHWGRRVPVWLLLLPAWVGTGFLVPMAVVILPTTLLSAPAADGAPFEPWVQPMVYGGFAWQGVFLGAAFALYVRSRWTVGNAPDPSTVPLLRVVAGGGTVMAGLSAGLHVAAGLGTGDPLTVAVATATAGLAVAGAAGVLAMVRGTRGWLAVAAAWVGSAAMFSWGLFHAALAMGGNPLGGAGDAIAGMAQLTGLLGGFALAVAGLLVLTAPDPRRRMIAEQGSRGVSWGAS